jgi:tetratricopeptide (TPR) repeat protein
MSRYRRTPKRILILGLFLCFCTAPAIAQNSDDEEQARAAFRLGRAYYDNGDFIKAGEQFDKAYRLSKKPELLYNVYVAYRDADMKREAATALRGYLADAKDIPNRGQLKARLETLERSIREEREKAETSPEAVPIKSAGANPPLAQPSQPPETVPVGASTPTATPAEPAQGPASSGAKRSLTPFILMGVGGALVLGSVITGIMASSASSELDDKCPSKEKCDPDLESTKSRGITLALTTDVLLFAGIATAGVGAVLFFLQGSSEDSKPDQQSSPVALGCGPRGCYGSVSLAF